MIPVLLSLISLTDPCALLISKIDGASHFKEAVFHLEYDAGELESAEIDFVASQMILSKRFSLRDKEKLDFLKLWERIRRR